MAVFTKEYSDNPKQCKRFVNYMIILLVLTNTVHFSVDHLADGYRIWATMEHHAFNGISLATCDFADIMKLISFRTAILCPAIKAVIIFDVCGLP